jgi:hypothetical protein
MPPVPRELTWGDGFASLVYGAGVVLAAVLIRGFMLWVYTNAVPKATRNEYLGWLEFVLDYGFLAVAGLLMVFDILKRFIVMVKYLQLRIRIPL